MHEPWRIVTRTVLNDEHENRLCDRQNQTKVNSKFVHRFVRPVHPVKHRAVGPTLLRAALLFLVNVGSACHDRADLAALINESNDISLGEHQNEYSTNFSHPPTRYL